MPAAIPFFVTAFKFAAAVYSAIGPIGQGIVQVIGLTAAQAVIANNTKKRDKGSTISLEVNAAAPRRLQIGQQMNGGILLDWFLSGNNNVKLYAVIALSQGPCGAMKRVYAGGRMMSTTSFPHGTRVAIPDMRSGGDRLWITYYDGRPGQTADATLVGLSQGWTSANKMTGIAYVVVEYQWDSDNQRTPVSLSFELEGAKLYDRRLDTSAGGSGSQSLTDPSTWTYSTNPAVALDHYLLGRYQEGVRSFGVGLTAAQVPYDLFEARANICDEDVDLSTIWGGTQKRYAAHGFLYSDDEYGDAIKRLCSAMAGQPNEYGGLIGVSGPEAKTPVMEIDDSEMPRGISEHYSPKRTWAEHVGGVEGRYSEPASQYRDAPYPRIVSSTWETEDGGEPRIVTLDLPMENHIERAQRLATIFANTERRAATLAGQYPPKAMELQKGDWFVRTGAKWGVDGKTFEVVDNAFDPISLRSSINAREVDPDDSAWDEDVAQEGPPTPADPTSSLADIEVPAITVTAIELSGTGATFPALKIEWDAPTDDRVVAIYVEVEPTDPLVGPKTSKVVQIPSDVDEIIIQEGILDGEEYAVSCLFMSQFRRSDWCVAEIIVADGAFAVGTASSVPWSGVTGAGRPDDNADVTSANTAAAIAGQGLLATLNALTQAIADASNLLRYASGGLFTGELAADVTSAHTAAAIASQGALATLAFVHLGSNVRLANGTTVATEAHLLTSAGTASAISGQGTFATLSAINSTLANANNLLRRSSGGLFTGELDADQTSDHTAAGIASQGSLATLNFVHLGSNVRLADGTTVATNAALVTASGTAAAISGQGGLATLSFITISTNIRLADGTTVATTAMIVTASGTAGAIAGQGSQATANHQRGSSYSGTPTEGSWWADTSTSELKLYTGGAWNVVSSIGAPLGNPLTVSFSPTSGGTSSRTGGSLNGPANVTATPGGGSGSYTVQWSLIHWEEEEPTLSNTSSATVTYNFSLSVGQGMVIRLGCLVTDTSTGLQKQFIWTRTYVDLI